MKDAGKIRFFEGHSPKEKLRKAVFLFLVLLALR